jgi:hypothetical protein
MVRLDHLALPVRHCKASRDWCKRHIGLELEFQIPEPKTAAIKEDADLTSFLNDRDVASCPGLAFTIPIDEVEIRYRLQLVG